MLIQRTKCNILRSNNYSDGIYAGNMKMKAIMEMPQPTNKKDIQRLLGLVNYVAKFLPNVSEITSPLREILKKDVIFSWESNQQKSFEQIKKLIASAQCVNLYDVNKDVVLEVDAFKTGLGAVLIQNRTWCCVNPRRSTSSLRV